MTKSLDDTCRCGHTRKEHCYGKSWTNKKGYYNINILKTGKGRCGGTVYEVGYSGPCGCTGFSTVPYK